ncbi:hypothetical protein [Fictibacillus enclensis]|uniref:hypothetical protein n=1 Tax=Fictibacillus enclensis TaxID=1017270 RepID=UPI0024C03039|nr:hypothetical protein [Fictibacillus enclensis]WHY71271.1 hypothetical protein QNH15_19995 [Fictibacillus enclensis]
MKYEILALLEEHKENILKDGKILVVSLDDGICTIEQGLDEAPFIIKVEKFDKKYPMTIHEFLDLK